MNYKLLGNRIDEIRQARGWSKSELARKMNMTIASVSSHINKGKMTLSTLSQYAETFGCKLSDLLDDTEDVTKFTLDHDITSTYPYNLVLAVELGVDYRHNLDDFILVDKLEEAKESVYSVYIPEFLKSIELLSERERQILELRFRHNLNLESISKRVGVTGERVRQIENIALRKLCYPNNYKKWKLHTVDSMREVQQERDKYRLQTIILKEKINSLIEKYNLEEETCEVTSLEEGDELDNLLIEELDLSLRSYHCLKRSGKYTLGDLKSMSYDDFTHIRNLGQKSLREIIHVLSEYGIRISYQNEEEE